MPESKFSIGPRMMVVSVVLIGSITLIALAIFNPDTADRLIDAATSILPGVSPTEGIQ